MAGDVQPIVVRRHEHQDGAVRRVRNRAELLDGEKVETGLESATMNCITIQDSGSLPVRFQGHPLCIQSKCCEPLRSRQSDSWFLGPATLQIGHIKMPQPVLLRTERLKGKP